MNIEITLNNIKELWGLYMDCKAKFYIHHYFNVKFPYTFEEFVEEEVTICNQCGEYVLKDNIGDSQLAINDNICVQCMGDGYGQ